MPDTDFRLTSESHIPLSNDSLRRVRNFCTYQVLGLTASRCRRAFGMGKGAVVTLTAVDYSVIDTGELLTRTLHLSCTDSTRSEVEDIQWALPGFDTVYAVLEEAGV